MSRRIHVLINGENFGPYPEIEFQQHVADRKILRTDLVWREGLEDWITAEAFLATLTAEQPPSTARPASPQSLFEKARSAANAGDVEQSIHWLGLAAEGGVAEAQYELGLRHANGQGVAQDDTAALGWFQKAADAGHAVAQSSLAYMLENGRGGPRDEAGAIQWYQKAAARGDAIAQNNLALMLATGRGVARHEAEAARWFRQAAEQGVPGAQTNFGLLLARGKGMAQDNVEAYKWFHLAAGQGHAGAVKNRDLLAAEMSPEQIAEGRQRAATLVSKREQGLMAAACLLMSI